MTSFISVDSHLVTKSRHRVHTSREDCYQSVAHHADQSVMHISRRKYVVGMLALDRGGVQTEQVSPGIDGL